MHLIQGEPVTEQGPALRQLGREHGQRMLLDLLHRSVEPPATGIAIPPLRTDDHVRMAALGQPAGQELLRPAVGTGRIDVPDPGRVRSIQHREGPGPQAGNAAVGQVLLTAAGDVRRAAQSGQPQPDPRDHRSPSPQRGRRHANPAPAVADHGHYRTGGPASGLSPGDGARRLATPDLGVRATSRHRSQICHGRRFLGGVRGVAGHSPHPRPQAIAPTLALIVVPRRDV